MMLNTVIDEAYQIIEEMMSHCVNVYKLQVCKENNELIRQLRKIAPGFSGFRTSYMGCVGGKRWFVIRDHSFDITVPSKGGELILVDFKAKKRMLKAA